ncbi:MAG: DUF3306 domain-containing protein [Pseudomonadota bacterium]
MSGSDFWSRRRAAVAKENRAEHVAEVAAERAREEAALAARSDDELLAEMNLPEPEALESPEAVREFLASALPQRLKTRALRQLWRMNPVLANLDGLVDYGQDFTDGATVVETLQTAYQVGRGVVTKIEEMAEADASVEALETPPEPPAPPSEDGDTDVAEVTVAPTPATIAAPQTDEARPAPSRRRMTFTFATATA